MANTQFRIGDRVHSIKIGVKGEFDGEIVRKMGQGYHVRDDADNRIWHRDDDDLTRALEKV